MPARPLLPGPRAFLKVFTEGTFLPVAALYGSEVRDVPGGSVIGAYLIQPLARPGEPTVLVNRGWVPANGAPPLAAGPARVEGYVRPPEPAGTFSARDNPAARRFFSLDPAAIGPALGVPNPAPYTLVALGPAVSGAGPGALPAPASALPRPPNDHLSYAITWFSLAVVALVISLILARKMRRA